MHYLDRELTIKKVKRKETADRIVRSLLFILAFFCASVILFIVLFIAIRGIRPFVSDYQINGESVRVNFWKFMGGVEYKVGEGGYHIGFIILQTFYITLLTMLLAGPISVMTALVIVRMSHGVIGEFLNGVTTVLASIPSVIFGVFGKSEITKWAMWLGDVTGFQTAGGFSTFTAVMVLTMMSVPTITMLSVTAIKAVNRNLVNGSLALGASPSETNFKVVLVAARSGIFSGLILGVNRALGEATAVSMVCGNAIAGPNFNPLDITSTMTSTMLTGMSESSGLGYDIRFSVGLFLIGIILITNLLLNLLNRKIGKGQTK